VTTAAQSTILPGTEKQLTPLERFLRGAVEQPKTTGPKIRNQNVVRSDQQNSGYHYNDWRNW
jgi:hypothetical protein